MKLFPSYLFSVFLLSAAIIVPSAQCTDMIIAPDSKEPEWRKAVTVVIRQARKIILEIAEMMKGRGRTIVFADSFAN